MATLAATIREGAAGRVPEPVLEAALATLGGRADRPVAGYGHDAKVTLINQFMRGLSELSVEQAIGLERSLLVAAAALPLPSSELATANAMNLIALRNHVRYLAVCLGFGWGESMQLQSVFSELGRRVQAAGGARIRFDTEAGRGELSVSVIHPGTPMPAPVRSALEEWASSLPRLVRRRAPLGGHDVVLSVVVALPTPTPAAEKGR
jgi:hypothetical protein